MRHRIQNTHNEPHGVDMREYTWIAPPRTNPNTLPDVIEKAVPGLVLAHRGGGHDVNGFIMTHRAPDGSLHIGLHLYNHDCADESCPHGHYTMVACEDLTCGKAHEWRTDGVPEHRKTIPHKPAPVIEPEHLDKIKAAVGEHPVHKLGKSEKQDRVLIKKLGLPEHI